MSRPADLVPTPARPDTGSDYANDAVAGIVATLSSAAPTWPGPASAAASPACAAWWR